MNFLILAYPGSALPDNFQGIHLDQDLSQAASQIKEAARKYEYLLFWDYDLGEPNFDIIQVLINQKNVDVWHSGLSLGMQDEPGLLYFVKPAWVLNCDANGGIESSSWRLSLRACLIRSDVIKQIGEIRPDFHRLEAAGLEFGYRCIQYGVIIRHTPNLLSEKSKIPSLRSVYYDELKFVYYSHGIKWCLWAVMRSIFGGYVNAVTAIRAFRRILRTATAIEPAIYERTQIALESVKLDSNDFSVTVLIATLDRYNYLRELLDQLRTQTFAPLEILVIDQTDKTKYDFKLNEDFEDLPLRIIYLEEQGQVISRNTGLQQARGEYILFIDDDDEIQPDIIELHLKNLYYFDADTSSGSVNEVNALPLTGVNMRTRISDVFPTNNTLIRKDILYKSGLFDKAFERKQSEDGDLGTRIHLNGALMIYNPQIVAFHHRAPRGGLRAHGARVITYSSSRQRLFHRRFPHISEAYIVKRYYSTRQVKENFWLGLAGTFSIRGGMGRKVLKVIIALALLPDSFIKLSDRYKRADELLEQYPQIPPLGEGDA